MFETRSQARLQSPFFVLEEGAQRWAYISQTSNDEWLFVTYETVDQQISSQQQFMISRIQFFLELATRDTPEQFIRQVQLVSPPWLNQKGAWLMEPLSAISRVDERVCYELVDGRVYPSKLAGLSRDPVWSQQAMGNE